MKISRENAAESDAAGDVIDRKLKDINRNANETRRSLDRVKLAGGKNGVGVGPFGSGFGRIGLLGTAIGAGALTAPAAVPAVAGLAAAVPAFATAGIGVVGTLALAFDGLGKAIGGDKKAFDDLTASQKQFVLAVRSLDGWLDKLKQTAAQGLFPGLTAGLHSALSVGTVSVITKAIQQFAAAIGNAGAAWGKYFGSTKFQAIFGPLMSAGARNFSTLADAALHLFDALGVLARAAIPLTAWISKGIDEGSKLADAWLHAKSATGGLSAAMREAQSSLRLVAGLGLSLLKVVGALGKALYPVSKVAVKDLTDGLDALAKIIQRNHAGIRAFVGGALAGLVAMVKTAWPIVANLAKGLSAVVKSIGGWKVAFELVIGGLLVSKFIVLGKSIAGVVTGIKEARIAMLGLGGPDVLAALAAAAIAFHEITDRHSVLNRAINDSTAGGPGDLMPVYKGGKWVDPATGKAVPDQAYWNKQQPNPVEGQNAYTVPTGQHGALVTNAAARAAAKVVKTAAVTHTVTSAALDGSVFGAEPPFTTNLGAAAAKQKKKSAAPPLIPPLASHAEALASANASKASVLGNVGVTATRYLNLELQDLTTAAKLIHTKYDTATGKARTELFAAFTSVENKIRGVRAKLHKTVASNRAAELALAVQQAKDAVASATVGSAAYKKAEVAEEKALKAQIAYLEKAGHNAKLSLAARTKALREATSDRKQLAALLKASGAGSTTADVAANESQFIQTYKAIVDAYAPNAQPVAPTGKTDTHLYDIKHELRQQTPLLKKALRNTAFPASGYATTSAGAVTG